MNWEMKPQQLEVFRLFMFLYMPNIRSVVYVDLPIMTLSKLNKVYSKLVSIDTASLMTVNQGLRWCHFLYS